jgi:hypothetical protein
MPSPINPDLAELLKEVEALEAMMPVIMFFANHLVQAKDSQIAVTWLNDGRDSKIPYMAGREATLLALDFMTGVADQLVGAPLPDLPISKKVQAPDGKLSDLPRRGVVT